LQSIPGLHKRLKIRALYTCFQRQGKEAQTTYRGRVEIVGVYLPSQGVRGGLVSWGDSPEPYSVNVLTGSVQVRETRKGWPLLIVKTELNGCSKSTNERGPSLVGLLGLSCRYKRSLFCPCCSSRPSKKYFFLTVHYFDSFVHIAQQAGQAAALGRLSLSMCLWYSSYPQQYRLKLPSSLK
jgi:hypothetical protein